MSRWRIRRKSGSAAVLSAEAPAPAAPAAELLGLQDAIEELGRLESIAAAAAAPARGRVLHISDRIHAVVEEPEIAPPPVERTFSSAWLPADCRAAFEILSPDCPPRLADGFRKLRGKLVEEQDRWAAAGRRLNSLAVVSPRRGSGRSVTARNLAACLGAAPDARVLLIDADAKRPSIHRKLRVPQAPGLADALRAGNAWREHVRRVPDSGIHVLPLGAVGAGIDSLDHALLAAFLERARGEFAWTIIDAPSMETADAEMAARVADGALLVLRNEREYFDEASAAAGRLDSARLLGAVLNFAG